MGVQINSRHGTLSEATRERIREKVEGLSRFIERVTSIDVLVELEKPDRPTVELVVSTELKHDFRAVYSSDDLFGCVDQAVAKVDQQMRKFKDKLTDHRAKETINGRSKAVESHLVDKVAEEGT
ncbi:MAG: ribosome hibernation-promoting factor, HPF/YfiA family [Thermoguttaceae bacterium]